MKKIISVIVSAVLCLNANIVSFASNNQIICLNETFSSYTQAGLPNGWKNYDANGNTDSSGIASGTGKTDQALHITNSTGIYGAFKEFTNDVMLGRTFCVEFDLYSTAQSGFYMSVLSDEAMGEISSTEQYIANAVIGMHTKQASGSTGVSKTPALGYASGSDGALTSFNSSSCKITTGAWNHIKLTVAPVSENKTNLTVSIDNGTEYSAESPVNLYTNQVSGIAFSSAKLARATQNQYVSIDNVSVYTFNEPPQVIDVSYWLDGEKQTGTVSELTNQIIVEFDVRADFSNINESVSVSTKDTREDLDCEATLIEDGKKIVITLKEPMVAGNTYLLEVCDGYLPGSEAMVMDVYTKEIAVVSDEFEVVGIKSYAEDVEVSEITTVTDTIKITFSNTISSDNLADKVYIEDVEGNKVNDITPLPSSDKEVEMDILGKLEEGDYKLKIDNMEYSAFNTITTSYEYPFNVIEEEIYLEDVIFSDSNGVKFADITNVPYILYSIKAIFDKPISTANIDNKIYLKHGEDTITGEYNISADSKEVTLVFENSILEKGEQYTFVISSDISHQGNGNVLIDSPKQFDFTVSSELMYDKKVYFVEDFNDFSGNGTTFPIGWHTVDNQQLYGGMYPDVGSSGEEGDVSLRLQHASRNARIIREFHNGDTIAKGTPFIAEWDVNMMDIEQTLRLHVLSEIDMTYHSSGPYVYYENVTLAISDRGSGYMTLNYPTVPRTSASFAEFKDTSLKPSDDGYYLKMPMTGWHKIKLEIIPKSEKITILNVSVDGGKVYSAETQLDYYTFQPAGVCVYTDKEKGAMFDNITVYTAQAIKEPQVSGIVILDYLSNESKTTDVASVATSAIKVDFDTAIKTDNISNYVKLYCGNAEVECDYETDVLNKYVLIKPKVFLNENSTYKIVVLPGLQIKSDSRFALQNESVEFFRTGEGDLFDIHNEELQISSDSAVFEFNMAQYDKPEEDYIVMMADYKDEVINVNGIEKTFKKLLKFETTSFTLSGNKSINKRVEFDCSSDSEYVGGYIISAKDNKMLSGMLKDR